MPDSEIRDADTAPDAAAPSAVAPNDPAPARVEVARPVARRSVLRGIGLAGAAVVAAGAGVLAYRGYDQGVVATGRGPAYEPWRTWRDHRGPAAAVAAALLAANPHNIQPWLFRIAGEDVDVYADPDPERRIPVLDPYDRELHVGLGCALENLVLAARAGGSDPQVRLLPDPGNAGHVATVTLRPGPRVAGAEYDAIPHRHTNRGPYRDRPIEDGLLGRMRALGAADDSGPRLVWVTDPAQRSAVSDLMVRAAEAVTADEQQSVDGFAWFRADWDDIQHHRDGLTVDAQGVPAPVRSAAKLLPAQSRQAGDKFWVAQTRTVHTRTAAAYGMILVPDVNEPADRLRGGQLLQRLHLFATAQGLALQHMNQITERADRERQAGLAPEFGDALRNLLDNTPGTGAPGDRVLVMFRAGYPVRAALASPRRHVSEVLR